MGYPGSGKTTFARQLADKTNAVHLHADRIRHELFDEPQHTRQENDVVYRLADYMFESFIKNGISVVYDANFNRRSDRMKVKQMADRYGAKTLVVWVQTDQETAFDRASSRDKRQTENKYAYQLPKDVFDRMKKNLTKPKFENYVVISGKHLFKNQFHAVMKRVKQLASDTDSQKRVRPVSLGGRVDLRRRQPRQ